MSDESHLEPDQRTRYRNFAVTMAAMLLANANPPVRRRTRR